VPTSHCWRATNPGGSGAFEDLQVFADGWPAHGQVGGELPDRQRTGPQALDDPAPHRITEGVENQFRKRLVAHE
jgi:hypothetical protein